MSYSIEEISNYLFYSLVPIYILLIINLICIPLLNRKTKSNKILCLIINILSILGTGSYLIFQGILSDNLINMKSVTYQADFILFLLILQLFYILISMIKDHNRK